MSGERAESTAPREGDPAEYVTLRLRDGGRAALTNTCAAVALGVVHDGDYASGNAAAPTKLTEIRQAASDPMGRCATLEARFERASAMHKAGSDSREAAALHTEGETLCSSHQPAAGVKYLASALKVTPLLADYGVIRKGTRAVRQFDLVNGGSTPITIQVSRSACRCLFYEYNGKTKVPPKGKERITVTVDGAKAAAGSLRETLSVTAKEDPSATAQFTVQAVIR